MATPITSQMPLVEGKDKAIEVRAEILRTYC